MKMKDKLFIAMNRMFSLLPLKKDKVLFFSDQRDILGGNLKCLYDYMADKPYKRKCILRANTFVKRTAKETIRLAYELSTSKYIILDDWNLATTLMERRKGQEIVQLWHGAGAFKTFGYTRNDKGKTVKKYGGHRNYSKAIVTAEDIRWCYADGFGMDIESVSACGFPRTDYFFDEKVVDAKRTEFFNEYPELKGKRIVIFAPTYRGVKLAKCYYDFEMLDIGMIKENLGDDYAFIIKWHPAVYDKIAINELYFDVDEQDGIIYDFSNKRDINDLLLVCDVLITDYSSVIFDYALLKKPIIYYAYDLERYTKNRGFYFDYEDYIYGPIARNLKELIELIKNPVFFDDKWEDFRNKFMGACDGTSTEKTYRYIFESNGREEL